MINWGNPGVADRYFTSIEAILVEIHDREYQVEVAPHQVAIFDLENVSRRRWPLRCFALSIFSTLFFLIIISPRFFCDDFLMIDNTVSSQFDLRSQATVPDLNFKWNPKVIFHFRRQAMFQRKPDLPMLFAAYDCQSVRPPLRTPSGFQRRSRACGRE